MAGIVASHSALLYAAQPSNSSSLRETIPQIILPLAFEPNLGQGSWDTRYLVHQNGLAAVFTAREARFMLSSPHQKAESFHLEFQSANPTSSLRGEQLLPGKVNYFRGRDASHWQRNVPTFGKIRYRELYRGIDLLFYGNGQRLEHDFLVSSGADPNDITLKISGASRILLSPSGDLTISSGREQIQFHKPLAYQQTPEGRVEVPVAFRLHRRTLKFSLGQYNHTLPLTIDPVLDYSTYLANDSATAVSVATDSAGNTYIAGLVFDPSYPVTTGAYQTTCTSCANSNPSVFVTKLKGDGTTQIYSTFLGGSNYNEAFGLAVDKNGNAVVVGRTSSSDFPLKNSVNTTAAGFATQWGFVTSLSPDGSSLNYSSVLGTPSDSSSNATTEIDAVALDANGNAYVSGSTNCGAFPVTTGALNAVTPAYPESPIFVSKFSPGGTLSYSAIIGDPQPQNGGGGLIGPRSVDVDSAGSAYVYGTAGTLWPTTVGAYQVTIPGAMPYAAPFVTKLAADGSSLVYSTFLGDGGQPASIKVNGSGQTVLVGLGPNPDYPVTSDAAHSSFPMYTMASWVTILDANGTGLVYSSFLTGGSADATALSLDSAGNIWVGGGTTDTNFPLLHPLQFIPDITSFGTTAFLMEFDASGKNMLFSTYYGGSEGGTRVSAVATDSDNSVHVTGLAGFDLFTTAGAFQSSVTPPPPNLIGMASWPFVAKLDPTAATPELCVLPPNNTGVGFYYIPVGQTSTDPITIQNCGTASLSISNISVSDQLFSIPGNQNHCLSQLAVDATCTLTLTFTPTMAVATAATLQFTSNATIPVTNLRVTGIGAVPVINIDNTQLQFDPMLMGVTSPLVPVFISNTGWAALDIDLAHTTITGDFAFANSGCDVPLPGNGPFTNPQRVCVLDVTFTPTGPGTRTGSLTIASNDPVNPTVTVSLSGTGVSNYTVPTITQLSPAALPFGLGKQNIQVWGSNFFPSSVVRINGQPQSTTYYGATVLSINIDPSLLTGYGELNVTVFNPSPGGGESAAAVATLYQTLPIDASFLVSVPGSNFLYAAFPSTASSNANTVVPFDPATGITQTPIPVGNNPRRLAASDDGKYLYVACDGDLEVQRINLATYSVDRTFPYPSNSSGGYMNAADMHAVPGSSQEVALAVGSYMAHYDDAGLVNALPSGSQGVSSFVFESPGIAYSLPFSFGQNPYFGIYALQGSPVGLPLPSTPGTYQPGAEVISDGSLFYTSAGEVWNASTATMIGTFPVTLDNKTSYPNQFNMELEASAKSLYEFGYQPYQQSEALVITKYNTTTLQIAGTLALPYVTYPLPTNLVRWGKNGLAFLAEPISSGPFQNAIYLLRTSLVSQSPVAALPYAINFGNQFQNTTVTSSFTYRNNTTSSLSITKIAITGNFTQKNNCPSSLTARTSCSITVFSNSASQGPQAGSLEIDDSSPNSPYIVPISTNGVASPSVAPTRPGRPSRPPSSSTTSTTTATNTEPITVTNTAPTSVTAATSTSSPVPVSKLLTARNTESNTTAPNPPRLPASPRTNRDLQEADTVTSLTSTTQTTQIPSSRVEEVAPPSPILPAFNADACGSAGTNSSIQPANPVYSDALDLAGVLTKAGLTIQCVLSSSMEGVLDNQKGAAVLRTGQDDVEVLFFSSGTAVPDVTALAEAAAKHSESTAGEKAHANASVRNSDYILATSNMLLVVSDRDLALKLEHIFGVKAAKR